MGRPPKAPEDRLVTLSVRVPKASLDLLNRIVEGEVQYLRQRHLPTHGVNRSTAFRTIWDLGQMEYVLQRVTLWVTRKTNRYTVEQAAAVLGWKAEVLRDLLRERGLELDESTGAAEPRRPSPTGFDTRFLE